jgi:mannosyltransferase
MSSVQTTVEAGAPAAAPVARPRPGFTAEHAAIAGEVLLALVIGTIGVGRPSFFPDESYTWSTVNRGFGALISVIVHHEAFQVLHTLLLWPINKVSDTSFVLRYPSVLFFAATVPAVWALGRRLFDARAGLVAGLLLSVNAFALQYAQEARSYAMALMFASYAAAVLAREVIAPTRWSRPAWIALSAAAVWAHGMAVFAIVAQVGSLLALPRAQITARRFLRSAVVIGVLVFPVVVAPFLQVNRAESFPDAGHPTLRTLRLFAWSMVGRSVFALVPYLAGGIVAVWAAYRVARAMGRSVETWRFAMPFLWLLFPPAFLISFSFIDPIWIERYALPSLGGLVVLVAYGLSRVRSSGLLAAILVFTVATASWGVVRWYDNTGYSDFDKLVATLEAERRPGDVFAVATDRSRIPMEFAVRHADALRRELPPVYPAVRWGHFRTGDQTGRILTPSAAQRALAHPRVWVVSGFYDPKEQTAVAIRRLRAVGFRETFHRQYDGPIVLYRFDRAGP